MIQFEKRPGADWLVDVLVISENEIYPTTVFGAVDQAAAERDALSSFALPADDLRIIKIERLPD